MLIRPLVLPETATKGDVPARVMKITINNNSPLFLSSVGSAGEQVTLCSLAKAMPGRKAADGEGGG